MANKGKSRHIKGLNAPKYMAIHRKEQRYVVKQDAGRHTLATSVALLLVAKKLNIVDNSADARKIIKTGNVSVNGKQVNEPKYPVGLNDIIEVKGHSHYKIGIDRLAKISIGEATKAEAGARICRIIGKYKAEGGELMLRLHDGSIVKGGKEARVNDSVVLDHKGKISKIVKLDIGSQCSVINGVHVGSSGAVKELKEGNMHKGKSAIIESKEGKFETLVKNIMVTG
ncbi:MAG TPA: S4 domain-containing protein [Candidatus Acidoferrales bacterium]|nr:S4 domain-containing protein [Candidatus Acidoferrales bacterium]